MANKPITLEKMKAYVDATWEKCQAEAWQVQEPIAWVYPEGLEALKSGRPWTAYGSSGGGRIPLYLNDAVAPKVEPRLGGSGAGFESLPASPTWQGLTGDERARFRQLGFVGVEIVEAALKERNS